MPYVPKSDPRRPKRLQPKRLGYSSIRRSLRLAHPAVKVLLGSAVLLFIVATSVYVYYYVRFSRMIDARLSGDIFNNASLVLSAPAQIEVGEKITPEDVASRLRKALYQEGSSASGVGSYRLEGEGLSIRPGTLSFFGNGPVLQGAAEVQFSKGKIASIESLDSHASVDHYLLEPQVITTLFDQSRTKRRLVEYEDLPTVLVHAVLAAEDHRFFSHQGVDFYRLVGAGIRDLRSDSHLQGASTLTMQLARSFFLTRKRVFRRKLEEIFLAFLLEQRLSKQQIFAMYANDVYLGQRGSFSINGFGEAAEAYFNKNVHGLTLPEAALLAGSIRGPAIYSPYRYPQRARDRRNWVLREMASDGYITEAEAQAAEAAPLAVTQRNADANQAPFFVDMVKDQLLERFTEQELLSQSYRIYTSLDLDLQQDASEAVREGMEEVDKQLSRRRRKDSAAPDPNQPQVSLIALDPHSGAILALVGGRDYGASQLNHALAKRQPGSSFKPFVYAAALSSGVDGSQPLVTAATTLQDQPTTFTFDGNTYEPRNYKEEYHGEVTLREALALSLNNATVQLAEMIGFDKVQRLATDAGINHDLLATPALALGAYVATPIEISGAYTIFANEGVFVAPRAILAVRDTSGRTLYESPETTRKVLDPRVCYLMDNLMESVINNGTAAGVRSRGFTRPAAGKTGTSHDGWFAGFTSNLLAVVWIGYDDDRELNLSGASSALPVWAGFLKRASVRPPYDDIQEFTAPSGIVSAPVEAHLAGLNPQGALASRLEEVFIAGTEPQPPDFSNRVANLLRRLLPGEPTSHASIPESVLPPAAAVAPASQSDSQPAMPASAERPPSEKKPGVLGRFIGIFKHGDKKHADDQQHETEQSSDTGHAEQQ